MHTQVIHETFPKNYILLVLADTNKLAISCRCNASVSSLCTCSNITLLRRSSDIVDRRYFFIRHKDEKLLSAVHVVTGIVRYNRTSLSISGNMFLAIGTTVNISVTEETFVIVKFATFIYIFFYALRSSNICS